MPEAGFEPTITASEQTKTLHALNRSATVTGSKIVYNDEKPTLKRIQGIVFLRVLGYQMSRSLQRTRSLFSK
jgi:hypothetical protein